MAADKAGGISVIKLAEHFDVAKASLWRKTRRTDVSEAKLRCYRHLAEAILLMAIRDWAGVAEVKVRRPRYKHQAKDLCHRDAKQFWHSEWARLLCEYVGWRYRVVLAFMYEAERNPEKMREVAERLKRRLWWW